jgi:SanA protein
MMKLFKIMLSLILLVGLFILITNIWVITSTKDLIFDQTTVQKNKIALVLGTSKKTVKGNPNRFFVERMKASAILYNSNKIEHILVSGSNNSRYYNEPKDMLEALGDLNIPEEDVTLDSKGFRTLDSVVRCKEVFGQNAVTIVTQEFHCYRALFIANKFDLNAIACSADEGTSIGISLAVREILARSFAVADLYIFRRRPKFSDERIEIDIN